MEELLRLFLPILVPVLAWLMKPAKAINQDIDHDQETKR